jgi:hypothetical protein
MGGYYLVTEDMAHVWVEVYLEGEGWVRKDPSAFAVNFSGARDSDSETVIAKIRKFTDSLNYYWNLTVIAYDLDKQLQIFRSANSAMKSISFPIRTRLILLVLLVLGGLVAVYWLAMRRWVTSSEERVLRTFFKKIAKKYPHVSRSSSTGLIELAEQTSDPHVREFAEIFCGSFYRDRRPTDSQMVRLRELLKAMENPS